MFAARHLRLIARILLVTFTSLTLQPVQAALRASPAAAQRPSAQTDSAEVDYSRTLRALEHVVRELAPDAARPAGAAAQAARPPLDTVHKVQKLRELARRLHPLEDEAEAGFAQVEAELKARHLPAAILARHRHAVQTYRQRQAEFARHLHAVERAGGQPGPALDGLARFLAQHPSHKQATPTDPTRLPFCSPEAKVRAPKESATELKALLQPQSPKPLLPAGQGEMKAKTAQVAPATATTSAAPAPEDLAETEDVRLTPAIQAQAAALHHDPVEIHHWVRNHIEFIPSYGSIQGSDLTLQTRRGNAFDTASLEIALLRASHIPARYAYGTIQVPADQVMNWVGGVQTPEAAQSLLGQGGIPNVGLISGGKIAAFKLEHVWVDAYVDFVPSRGAKHQEGDTWVPLDASFKRSQFRAGADLASDVPLNAQGVVDAVRSGASCSVETAQNLDAAALGKAVADFRQNLSNYVAARGPDITVADLLGSHSIVNEASAVLASSLPYQVLARTTAVPALADSLRWQLRYAVFANEQDRSQGQATLELKGGWPALASERVTLSFAPTTQADADTLASYLPAPHLDGSPIRADEFPASLPGYLIHLRAELRVDGQLRAAGGDFTLGQPLLGTLERFDPTEGGWQASPHELNAGEYHALALDGQGIAAAGLERLERRLGETQTLLAAVRYGELDRERVSGDLLYQLALVYLALIDVNGAAVADAARMADVRLPSHARAMFRVEPTLAHGIVVEASFPGLALRADHLASAAVGRNTPDSLRAYPRQAQQRASAYAHLLLDRVLTDVDRPGAAVATVRALAAALRGGIPILSLTPDTDPAFLQSVTLDAKTQAVLGDALTAGLEVTVQRDPVTLGAYRGGGYVLEDPFTGSGEYRISTALAGGASGLLAGPVGLGVLAVAQPFQAAGLVAPALPPARNLDGQLAALQQGRAVTNLVRWSAYPGQSEIAAALFLARLSALETRDACDRVAILLAAGAAASLGLPGDGHTVNHPPQIISTPITDAVANQAYRYQLVATDSDGDARAYRLLEAPGGAVLDSAGRLSWVQPIPGSYPIVLRVDDGQAFAEQRYTLNVGDAMPAVQLTLDVTPTVANPGDTVLVKTTVLGGTGAASVRLTVDGQPAGLDANGQARLTAPASGSHPIVATATDGADSVTQQSLYSVRDGIDATPPTALITAPAADSDVTGPFDLIGTASDTNFAYYQLLVRPAGAADDAWREVSRSYTPVTAAVLGRVDTATLANGLYQCALRVVDVNGQSAMAAVAVTLMGDLKLGPFRVAFEDLSVEAAGLPVRVIRGYDSLKRQTSFDFGPGWSVDYQNVSLRKNMTLGLGWQVDAYPTQFKLCLRPVGQRKIAIALPDGKVERFTAYNEPECASFQVPPLNTRFTAAPGTTGTLEVAESNASVLVQGGMLVDTDTGGPWNPTHFKLIAEDGTVYYIQEGIGIERVQDPFGNTLTYGPNGIVHSAGLSVAFQRDGQGRITQITDPAGKALHYRYNSRGELVSVTDREGRESTFRYARDHLLSDYTDPRGVKASQQIYDSQGRLIALVDAEGKRTDLSYDDAASRQTVADRLGNRTTYVYDAQGNVVEVIDPLGQSTRYTYDALGNETAVTDPLGHTRQRTYDAKSGKILSETDPLGHGVAYGYDSATKTQLQSYTDALGRVIRYTYFRAAPSAIQEPLDRTTVLNYDGQGNLTQLDLAGQKTQYSYNAKGQKTAETDPAGRTVNYTLDADGREIGRRWTVTGSDGQVKAYQTRRILDAEGRVLEETDATGAVIKRQYNGAGQVAQETDALGRITTFEYDAKARLTKTTYSDGTFEATAYDANGHTVAETDRAGRITRHSYDALGRRTQTVHPDGATTQTEYDAVGRIVKTVDAQGQVTTSTYDAAGRLTAVTTPDGQSTQYVHDANGNRTQTTAPDGQVTRFDYDELNRLVKTTYSDGTFSTVQWRADGLKASETDAAGKIRSYAYDPAGRLSQVTEAQGNEVTVYAHDEAGNKIRQVDAEGRVTRWDYDADNRQTARILPGGEQEIFQYDAVGHLTAHTGFDGQTTQYGYDAADHRTLAKHPDGRTLHWIYTADGHVASVSDARGLTRYQYDAQGRKTQETRPDGTQLAWAYDAEGRITQRSAPGGTTRYQYDAQGRLAQVTDPQGQTMTYAYDAAGRLQSQTAPNGIQTRYGYDTNGRLIQLLHTQANGALLSGYRYTLADNGQRTQIDTFDSQCTLSNGQAQNPVRTTRYSYDPSGRLTQETVTDRNDQTQRSTAYAYDKVGNRVQKTETTLAGTQTTQYTYDSDDRLVEATATLNGTRETTTYAWDTNGRLTKQATPAETTLYVWDADDHLIEVKRGSSEATAQTQATYQYDADGNRVQKTEKTAQGDKTTHYLIDDTFPYAQVVQEKTTLNRQTQATRYVWGHQLIAQLKGGQGLYYHTDGLGSIKALTDTTGSFTDTYEYQAFGEPEAHAGTTEQPYRFAGEHYDPTVKLQYHRARWYWAEIGRFTALDPYRGRPTRPATLHKYAYANVDPVNGIDPSGQMTMTGTMVGVTASFALFTMAAVGLQQPFGLYGGSRVHDDWHTIGLLTLLSFATSATKTQLLNLTRTRQHQQVDLYRAVQDEEMLSIMNCNCIALGPSMFPKQFFRSQAEAVKFGYGFIKNVVRDRFFYVIHVVISEQLYRALDHSAKEPGIGPITTVQNGLLPAFNEDVARHGGIRVVGEYE